MQFQPFLDFLFPPREDEVVLRFVSTEAFLALMRPVVIEAQPATVALLPFSNQQVRAAIHEAKYHGSAHAVRLLGAALADYLCDLDQLERRTVRVVPVPLAAARYRERGYNQAEEIARSATRALGLPLETDLLIRARETRSQVSLTTREREKNVRGAFESARAAEPADLYLLVDDVVTTGATLRAAAAALRRAGARHVMPLALAH